MLRPENERSVAYRYDTRENLPGPVEREEPAFYRFTASKMFTRRPNPVEALKLIRCYEYQSCEHPGWESSEAKGFCDTMTAALVACLPGYDDAPWEWTRDAAQVRSVAR